MSACPFDIVAFDLDGTLADTAPDIAAGLNRMLADFGRPALTTDAIRPMIGDGAKNLIRRVLEATGGSDEALVLRAHPLYLDHYLDHVCEGTRPYPGVAQALDELTALGVTLAICTNKAEPVSLALLAALGWSTRFAALVGGDSLGVRKPDPRMLHETVARAGGGRCAFVGDTIVDAETARAAGVPFVAVSFGFRDRPAEALGADALIDSYAQLIPALCRIGG